MSELVKFRGPDLDPSHEFSFPDVFEMEATESWSRLRIGLREGEVATMLDLCAELPGPFGVLYVLVVSRLEREVGRYQSPYPVDLNELTALLHRYRGFIEEDGRHHIWVSDVSGEGQIVFDRHNLLYAYGPLDRFRARLRSRGVTRGTVRIPSPHAHEYHVEFDSVENELMSYWAWRHSPLRPDDEG